LEKSLILYHESNILLLILLALVSPGFNQILDKYINRLDPIIKRHEGFAPVAEDYFNRATSKMEIQNYQGAIEDFSKAIEIDPEYSEAYNNRGIAKRILNDYTGAMEDFTGR